MLRVVRFYRPNRTFAFVFFLFQRNKGIKDREMRSLESYRAETIQFDHVVTSRWM